jgi:acetylornithine deacetylase/succinyl-diaminopimelate desuccinylase-like protein
MISFHGLIEAVDADRDAMRDLLCALVAIPTENPPGSDYRPCVALLESTLRTIGFPYERLEIPSPVDAPRVALRAAWRRAPFGLLETRFYAERGVPALAYGPGILAVSHGPQEFVKVSRMVECAKIYALTAAVLLGGDNRDA